jgi:hypothetical protein
LAAGAGDNALVSIYAEDNYQVRWGLHLVACNDDAISMPYDWPTAGSAAGSATRYKMIQSLVSNMVVVLVLRLLVHIACVGHLHLWSACAICKIQKKIH